MIWIPFTLQFQTIEAGPNIHVKQMASQRLMSYRNPAIYLRSFQLNCLSLENKSYKSLRQDARIKMVVSHVYFLWFTTFDFAV